MKKKRETEFLKTDQKKLSPPAGTKCKRWRIILVERNTEIKNKILLWYKKGNFKRDISILKQAECATRILNLQVFCVFLCP